MCTGRTEVRRRRECCEAGEVITLGAILVICVVVLGFGTLLHITVHSSNSCSMTYMYRKLQFMEIPMTYGPSDKYSLVVYNEGSRWWNKSYIEAGQIPVLFIPGSQGSAKQVRSLASVMQNKTESRRAPFSFRFFAVDFDEEVTFMNGNIINRQLDYVMHAVRKIRAMMRLKRKVVLVGHSYGGMIAVLTVIHPEFRNDVELVILKAAPVNKQPILVDWMSMRLSLFLVNQWNDLQATVLERVGVIAYSGGIRDFQIPDEWSAMTNVTHRPLWAIDGVSDLGADHQAVLWCNEFVRHVSRVLWSYAENFENMTGRAIVKKFYNDVTDENVKRANLTRHVADVPWKEIKVGERYKGLAMGTKQLTLVIRPERFQVVSVKVNGTCVNSMTTIRHDEALMHFENATNGAVETWIYRVVAGEKVRLLLDLTLPCSIDVQLTEPMKVNAWRFYEIMFSYLLEVGSTFITFTVFFGFLLREHALHRSCVIVLTNFVAIIAVFYGSVNTLDTLAIPMAIGYFMALGWRFVCFLIGDLLISRFSFIQNGHKALKDDKLMNGLFLVCGALIIVATNEGSILLITLLSYRHHPTAVLMVIPALVPHFLRMASFPLFSMDALVFYDLQYHPAFYAACIYLWGLLSSEKTAQLTMRMLVYGITPALLYLLSSPLELYSGYALIIFSAASFVPNYGKTHIESNIDHGHDDPKRSPHQDRHQHTRKGGKQRTSQNRYDLRHRKK